jgi:hypothetical protein
MELNSQIHTIRHSVPVSDDGAASSVRIQINLVASSLSDVQVQLVHPDGTVVALFDSAGCSPVNLFVLVFDDSFDTPISSDSAGSAITWTPW